MPTYTCSSIPTRRRATPPPLDQPWPEALIGRSYEARGPEPRPQSPHLVVVGWRACGGGFGQVALLSYRYHDPLPSVRGWVFRA